MTTSPLHIGLQLHHVPAGCRLDFTVMPDCYAQVYRRCQFQGWECVARNACSPFIDRASMPVGAAVEYVVLYHNAQGGVTGATAIVQTSLSQQHKPLAYFKRRR